MMILVLATLFSGEPDLSGVYAVHGVINGKPYAGTCLIMKGEDDDYKMQWTSVPGKNVIGIGVIKKDKFICSWIPGPGLSFYEIKGKNLVGQWMQQGQWFDEELTFIAPLPKERNSVSRPDLHDLRCERQETNRVVRDPKGFGIDLSAWRSHSME